MRLVLTRFGCLADSTLGLLRVADMVLFSMERAWRDNEPQVSCVPDGLYELVPHSSVRFPETWALVGETVSHFPDPSKRRSAILFHAANVSQELEGCIAPGLSVQMFGAQLAVTSSQAAMDRLRSALGNAELLPGETHSLEIDTSREIIAWASRP